MESDPSENMDRIISEYNAEKNIRHGEMRAIEVFKQNNGSVTSAYYASLAQKSPLGPIAVALFRAQKRSWRAKQYRRGKWARAAYDVKNWSISELCRLLKETSWCWGWKRDPSTPGYEWVLYVDLPFDCGQVSFHNPQRGEGPDYPKDWDQRRECIERIIRFCDLVFFGNK
jgi:hypothetical protein